MALYGQTSIQRPHLIHLSWSMNDLPFTNEMASFGQTSLQGWAKHPWQVFVTMTCFSGQALHANLMILIMYVQILKNI